MKNIGFLDVRTTKGQIIEVLSEADQLTSKQIFDELKDHYYYVGTYQGIHKALKEMLANKVATAKKGKYSLNHDWISSAKIHVEELEKKVKYKEPSIQEIASKETTTIYFDKFIDIGRFVLEKFGNMPDPENKEFITIVNHTWPAIALSPPLFKLFQAFHKKNKNYILIKNNTIIDKINAKPFQKNGAKIVFDKKTNTYPDTLIKGDYVLYAHFDHNGRTIYDQFCQATKSLKNLDLIKLFTTLFETHFKHKITIIHDKQLANEIRKNTLKKFGKK